MGSAGAGARVGAVAGLYFAGLTALADALMLISTKSTVLTALTNSTPTCTESCYSDLFTQALPIFFVGLVVVSFLSAVLLGVFFELVPGKTYFRKGLLVAIVMLVVTLNTFTPIAATGQQELLMISVELALTIGYAVIASRLYRRLTRRVEFQSSDKERLKVKVLRRDQTGKTTTFAMGSTQTVEASAEGRAFKGWVVSGGVTVEDAKSPVTKMHVLGDGLLKAT